MKDSIPQKKWNELTEKEKESICWFATLSAERRAAIVQVADSRIFWEGLIKRASNLRGLATWILTIAAFLTLMYEGVSKWLGAK